MYVAGVVFTSTSYIVIHYWYMQKYIAMYHKIAIFFIFIYHTYTCSGIRQSTFSFGNGIKYNLTIIKEEMTKSEIECAIRCKDTVGCRSANGERYIHALGN